MVRAQVGRLRLIDRYVMGKKNTIDFLSQTLVI